MLRHLLSSPAYHAASGCVAGPSTRAVSTTAATHQSLAARLAVGRSTRSNDKTSRPTRGRTNKQPKDKKQGKEKRELTASGLPKLRAYDLTQRLDKKCEENLDEAYEELQRMPRDAQDIVSWNTMIWHAMKAARYKLAYQMFVEMKRRSFAPNARTYRVMLAGYSRIEGWEGRTMNRQQVKSVYDAYQAYLTSARKASRVNADADKEVDIVPINYYLQCLGNMGDFTQMWDIFNALPADGPGAANAFTYATILARLAERRAPTSGEESLKPKPTVEEDTDRERRDSESELKMYQRNGSDALLVWHMMLRAIGRRNDLRLDTLPLMFTLQNLLRSPSEEHCEVARGLLAEYFGLTDEPGARGKLALDARTLHVVLSSLVASRRFELCLHYTGLITRSARFRPIIDVGHMDDALAAHAGLARPPAIIAPADTETNTPPRPHSQLALELIDWMLYAEHDVLPAEGAKSIRPRLSSFTLALRACWHALDWPTACTIFERMTGMPVTMFTDKPDTNAVPLLMRRPVTPDAEALAHILRTGLAAGGPEALRTALRIVERYSVNTIFQPSSRDAAQLARDAATTRLAALIVRAVQTAKNVRQSQWKKLGRTGDRLHGEAMAYIRASSVKLRPSMHLKQERYRETQMYATRPHMPRVSVPLRGSPRVSAGEEDEFAGAAAKLRAEAEAESSTI
ncbi:hypothetical protein EXIGLDRAFT_844824 [Exidia glandulosa HHB12029]|uniref:Pentacotripeptide-repeat region of PRORP domain-containing protein n=1 Tax=Exidia glandulosa HHB12029 TaxID=1314781 RepID=A0A165BSN2_EXIGL|nr:hypothetical protein EXIGLDRAFT_844824 [Exidia glandulosa HHB12029]